MNKTSTSVSTAFAIALGVSGCVIGETDDVDATDQLATNKPWRNGCDDNLTVPQCAKLKAIDTKYICGFMQRVPNAYFVLHSTFLSGTIDSKRWRFDRSFAILPTISSGFYQQKHPSWGTWGNVPLGKICQHYLEIERQKPGLPGLFGAYLPTELGCSEQILGRWSNGYCYESKRGI